MGQPVAGEPGLSHRTRGPESLSLSKERRTHLSYRANTVSLLLIFGLTVLLNLLKVFAVLKTDIPLTVTLTVMTLLGRKWKLAIRWLLLFPHFSNMSTLSHVINMYTNQDSVPVIWLGFDVLPSVSSVFPAARQPCEVPSLPVRCCQLPFPGSVRPRATPLLRHRHIR